MPAPALRIRLALPGRRVEVARPAPTGPVRLDELLPFMYAVDDAAIGVAVGQARKQGATVSCAKGCSACCRRQPVPVTLAEAHGLARRVQALPAPRRARVEQRFADAAEQLRAAGLLDTFMRDTPVDDPAQARAAATAYMALGLVCPFLEDDACSIHAQRPFVCRQYLVSSPPSLCADPLQQPVAVLDIPVRPASAMLAVTPPAGGRPAFTVPLVLALAYAARHADTQRRCAPDAGAVDGRAAAYMNRRYGVRFTAPRAATAGPAARAGHAVHRRRCGRRRPRPPARR